MKKIYSLLLLFSFICVVPSTSANYGEGDETENNSQIGITASDIEAIPGDFLYYWVSFKRKIKSTFTLSAFKKSELDFKIADEIILEIQALAETEDRKLLAKHINKYNRLIEKIKIRHIMPLQESEEIQQQLIEIKDRHLPFLTSAEQKLSTDLLVIARDTKSGIIIKTKRFIYGTVVKIKSKISYTYQAVAGSIENFIHDEADKIVGPKDKKIKETIDEKKVSEKERRPKIPKASANENNSKNAKASSGENNSKKTEKKDKKTK